MHNRRTHELPGDPIPVLRDAITSAHRDRSWLHVWMVAPSLAAWWVTHHRPDAAAVVVGHLDAHGLGGMDTAGLIDTTRAAVLQTQLDVDQWLAHGARLDRDQLVGYILEQLLPDR